MNKFTWNYSLVWKKNILTILYYAYNFDTELKWKYIFFITSLWTELVEDLFISFYERMDVSYVIIDKLFSPCSQLSQKLFDHEEIPREGVEFALFGISIILIRKFVKITFFCTTHKIPEFLSKNWRFFLSFPIINWNWTFFLFF